MALRGSGCPEAGRVPAIERERGSRPSPSPAHRWRQDHALLPEERDRSGTTSFNALSLPIVLGPEFGLIVFLGW
jgi:hypothetical protein